MIVCDGLVRHEAMDFEIETSKTMNREGFSEQAIRKAFTTFDLDQNGYICVAELKHILIMMGEQVSDEEVEMMVSMLDDGEGQVSYSVRSYLHAL